MSNVKIRYRDCTQKTKTFINVSRLFSYILVIAGISLFLYTITPTLIQYVKIWLSIDVDNSKPIIEADYYNPDLSYFQNISQQAYNLNYGKNLDQFTIDINYTKTMNISIPSVQINATITPNIESNEKEEYNKILRNGAAHFKYTPLPGDGGNSFIYGHSGTDMYYNKNPNNMEIIFTRLKNIEIGDEIEITKDEKKLKYRVIQEKIVSPEDVSILEAIPNKETITLMTCYPWGIGTHRFIVIAERINK